MQPVSSKIVIVLIAYTSPSDYMMHEQSFCLHMYCVVFDCEAMTKCMVLIVLYMRVWIYIYSTKHS